MKCKNSTKYFFLITIKHLIQLLNRVYYLSFKVVLIIFIVILGLQALCCQAQPGLIKMCTSVHFLARLFLRNFLHVSLQLQIDMSTEWR